MKKFVSGVIVGAFLFAGVSAFADSSSLIGQKVQGLFAVEKGGTKIADAVIINGSAYAPVRAVSQAAGVGLTVEGKTIKMSEPTTTPEVVSNPEPTATPISVETTNKSTISSEKAKEQKIASFQSKLVTISGNIAMTEAQLRDKPENVEYQQKLADLKAQYAELQSQLAELQQK